MSAKLPRIKSDYSTPARLKRWFFLLIPTRISVFIFRKFIDDDRERNSIEAAKFLVDTNNIYPTRFYFLLGKFLRFSLALADAKLPKAYVHQITKSLSKTRRKPFLRKKMCEQILHSTAELDVRQTSAHGWKLVSLGLSGLGFIRAGTIARNYCLSAALIEISQGLASNRTTHLAIKGLLESRQFDEARNLIESFAKRVDPISLDETYGDYLSLMKQPRPNLSRLAAKTFDQNDELFSRLVKDKRVAIVAPGVINKEYGHEIDSHDTVLRIKFNGRSAMPDEKLVGRRCDITSHNSDLLTLAKTDSLNLGSIFLEATDIKMLIAKKGNFKVVGGIPVREMSSWAPTFLTTATSGTLMIYEVLREKPKMASLFGYDFYTNRQIYNQELLSTYRQSSNPDGADSREHSWNGDFFSVSSVARSHISHDLKSDFLLVKNLYELSGLIDGAPEVLEILNLTADEYDMRLEEMLGDW